MTLSFAVLVTDIDRDIVDMLQWCHTHFGEQQSETSPYGEWQIRRQPSSIMLYSVYNVCFAQEEQLTLFALKWL